MQCSKCNSENVSLRTGVSKKTGKPWKGLRCADCNEMTWLKADAPAAPTVSANPVLAGILQELKVLNAKMQRLVDVLAAEKGQISVGPEELEPDENAPVF